MDIKEILENEIDTYVREIPAEELKKTVVFLQEAANIDIILHNKSLLSSVNEITPENWAFIEKTLLSLVDDEEFQKQCKLVNCKLYCVKYFSKIKLSTVEFSEDILKQEVKKYFKQLAVENKDTFIENLFSLPFEFVSLLIRWFVNTKAKEHKNKLTPQLKTAEAYYELAQEVKTNFIKNINELSLGKGNVFSLEDLKLLLDVKAFFEFNLLNVGTVEFVMRMFLSERKKIEDKIGKREYELLKTQALHLPSYIQFLNNIESGKESPFFTTKGLQIPDREVTFDSLTTQIFNPEEYIPEPIAQSSAPAAPLPNVTAEQPSAEELNPENPSEEIPGEIPA